MRIPEDASSDVLLAVLRGCTARKAALAHNLANADTPGYRRVDVDLMDALRKSLGRGDDVSKLTFRAAAGEAAGKVQLGVEMVEMAKTDLLYGTALAALKHKSASWKAAAAVGCDARG